MNLDLSFLQPLLAGLSPQAALFVGAGVLIVQHLAQKQGANPTLGGLLGVLSNLFGGKKTPVADVPVPAPVVPTPVPSSPSVRPADPLANKPVLKGLRDILASLAVQRLTQQLATAPDDHEAALATYQRVASALTDPRVGLKSN